MELYNSRFKTIRMMDNQIVAEQIWYEDTENMTPEDFIIELEQLLRVFKHYRLKRLFIDASNLRFAVRVELQEWIAKNFLSYFSSIEGKKVAIVKSNEIIVQLSIEQTMEELKSTSYKTEYFNNEEEAKLWLLK